jgi:hypothetical protein
VEIQIQLLCILAVDIRPELTLRPYIHVVAAGKSHLWGRAPSPRAAPVTGKIRDFFSLQTLQQLATANDHPTRRPPRKPGTPQNPLSRQPSPQPHTPKPSPQML